MSKTTSRNAARKSAAAKPAQRPEDVIANLFMSAVNVNAINKLNREQLNEVAAILRKVK